MKKKLLMTLITLAMSMTIFFSMAVAASIDISVAPDADKVYYRYWWYGGSDRGWDVGANPNTVFHSYSPGDGRSMETALSFDLTSFTNPATDIVSASFNFNILDIWTEGRNDVANLNGHGTVYADGGTGWKSFDVTNYIAGEVSTDKIADFYFSYTGYSGFTFGSAEGGNPAFLRITTAETGSAVPVPATMFLLGSGLLLVTGARRKSE
ncbi:MAG: PEP-CTERM sorting domain-containing protein [Desulfobacula sp.]|jgi:hypothetical protein